MQLRREQKQQVKRRKVLSVDDDSWNIASDDDRDDVTADDAVDIDSSIRDLEFRLTNEIGQLSEQINASRRMALKDVTLLKVVLCSGLYPQVAIADEYNSFKRESDHVFHTHSKGFVLLHPNSVFATHPESLQLKESQIKESNCRLNKPSSANRGQLSNGHQLVAFVSLVETTKPYLVGAMRVPALQTTLLFAQSIDTNADCSRIVCDEWLEITFESPEDGESIISAAVRLRAAWQQLLQLKLQNSGRRKGLQEGASKRKFRIEHLQSVLYVKLAEFLHSNVFYYIRRIHAAEHSHLYVGCLDVDDGDSSSAKGVLSDLLLAGGTPHPIKGGTVVAGGYLVYNCLQDDATSAVWGEYTTCMQRHWTCPRCEHSFVVTIGERLDHEQRCETQQLELNADSLQLEAKERVERDRFDALRKPYKCSTCEREYSFTTAETLRHKKTCKSSATDEPTAS